MLLHKGRHAALYIHLGQPDELIDRLRCLEFAHIEPDHAFFVAEIDMRERFGGLSLPYASGPQEEERPIRFLSFPKPARALRKASAICLIASA